MKILNIKKASQQEITKLQEIFFEASSVQDFEDDEEKETFLYKYFEYYRIVHSSMFFYIKNEFEVYGYICGVENTKSFDHLAEVFPYYKNLEDNKLLSYPSHLHINLSENSRGMGHGKQLIDFFCSKLYSLKIPGVHIFTGANSRNQSFYRRNGFCDELSVEYNKSFVHFMGRKIYSI